MKPKQKYTVKVYVSTNTSHLVKSLDTDIFDEVQDFIFENCQKGYDCALVNNETGESGVAYAADFTSDIDSAEDLINLNESSKEKIGIANLQMFISPAIVDTSKAVTGEILIKCKDKDNLAKVERILHEYRIPISYQSGLKLFVDIDYISGLKYSVEESVYNIGEGEKRTLLNNGFKFDGENIWKNSNGLTVDTSVKVVITPTRDKIPYYSNGMLNKIIRSNSIVTEGAKVITINNLKEGLTFKGKDFDEIKKLATEIGIYTVADLEAFMKEPENIGKELLTALRDWREELGADFVIKESVLTEDVIRTYFRNSDEYRKLKDLVDRLNQASSKNTYTVGETYFDYGQDWKWTTILADPIKPEVWQGGYQVLCPRDFKMILSDDAAVAEEGAKNVFEQEHLTYTAPKGEIRESLNSYDVWDKLYDVATSVKIQGPSYRGAAPVSFVEDRINEAKFADGMRAKFIQAQPSRRRPNTIEIDYTTQGSFTPDEAKIFAEEIKRAMKAISKEEAYVVPFDVDLYVVSRDGSEQGLYKEIFTVNKELKEGRTLNDSENDEYNKLEKEVIANRKLIQNETDRRKKRELINHNHDLMVKMDNIYNNHKDECMLKESTTFSDWSASVTLKSGDTIDVDGDTTTVSYSTLTVPDVEYGSKHDYSYYEEPYYDTTDVDMDGYEYSFETTDTIEFLYDMLNEEDYSNITDIDSDEEVDAYVKANLEKLLLRDGQGLVDSKEDDAIEAAYDEAHEIADAGPDYDDYDESLKEDKTSTNVEETADRQIVIDALNKNDITFEEVNGRISIPYERSVLAILSQAFTSNDFKLTDFDSNDTEELFVYEQEVGLADSDEKKIRSKIFVNVYYQDYILVLFSEDDLNNIERTETEYSDEVVYDDIDMSESLYNITEDADKYIVYAYDLDGNEVDDNTFTSYFTDKGLAREYIQTLLDRGDYSKVELVQFDDNGKHVIDAVSINESFGSLHNNPNTADRLYNDSLNRYQITSIDGKTRIIKAKCKFDAEELSGWDTDEIKSSEKLEESEANNLAMDARVLAKMNYNHIIDILEDAPAGATIKYVKDKEGTFGRERYNTESRIEKHEGYASLPQSRPVWTSGMSTKELNQVRGKDTWWTVNGSKNSQYDIADIIAGRSKYYEVVDKI